MTRKTLLVLLASGATLIASTNLPAAPVTPTSASSSSPEQAAREEVVRRQEAQITARKLIDEGEKLYYSGKYQEAIAKLEEAIRILPRAQATEIDYSRAVQSLTTAYSRLADASFQAGDYTKARELAQKSLEYDPKNRAAGNVIVKTNKVQTAPTVTATGQYPSVVTSSPPGTELDKTPEFLARKDEIKKLFREGKILMNSGQYDEAERRFQQILLLDPYNADAATLLRSIDKARINIGVNAQDESRTHILRDVTDAWVPPLSHELQAPTPDKDTAVIGREAVRQQGIMRKLNDIIVPEINYREAVVSDVITFLSDESRRLDPEKVGVNIVLGGGIVASAAPSAAPAAAAVAPGAQPETGPGGAGNAGDIEGRKITLSLRNVPLIDALKYVTTLANLKYRVEPSAVIVLPIDAAQGDLVTRSYSVEPGAFKTVLSGPPAAAATGGGDYRALGNGAGVGVSVGDIKTVFTEAGVPFPPGSSLVYNDRTSTIIIRNTPENLEIFERVLNAYSIAPKQVEIDAKFVEISQTDLDELGFDWQLGTKSLGSFDATGGSGAEAFPPGSGALATPDYDLTSGLRGPSTIQANAIDSLLAGAGFGTVTQPQSTVATIRGILTNPQFQVMINALAQKQSADTLSSPKVTTISGAQAQIRVVQEFIYPTEFQPPTATAAGGGTTGGGAAAVTPSTPGSFKTREVGVLLNVTPTVGADGRTINLTLVPEVSQFLGFINYGGPISIAAGNDVVTTFNDIKQPLFSTENLTTSILIYDGQTVVLGGLITESLQKIDDKVPFLGDLPLVGRLFQSKTTSRSKRNLLIFVTARLIDPAGNPINRAPLTAGNR
jgi:general secretion pathway protein D